MSQQQISHSPDLQQLRNDGYDIQIISGHLVLKKVPYVNQAKEIKFGTLVSTLNLINNITTRPDTHVMYFEGEYPCNTDGFPLDKIRHQSSRQQLGTGVWVDHSFSSKPASGYDDYYKKMTTYALILSSHAQAINPEVSPRSFPTIQEEDDESVFKYIDTASSRAGISAITSKLRLNKIAIVGLGGTGSYVLDLIAKTPINEIHLFDGDKFLQHNAFRSPGAPSGQELSEQLYKTEYFEKIYSKMRRGIVSHSMFIDATTVELLREMDFVFICIDQGETKKIIVETLHCFSIPFVDVGMGVNIVDQSLLGMIRVTSSTPDYHAHISTNHRIPFTNGDGNNEYDRNIQIADLNALNAALAVVKWKKIFGFYVDLDKEHFSVYTIDGNFLINEDKL